MSGLITKYKGVSINSCNIEEKFVLLFKIFSFFDIRFTLLQHVWYHYKCDGIPNFKTDVVSFMSLQKQNMI